mmetsp:Transcript_9001/g.14762  ORF Transcript_9001/g.14762 Transcript_9001/m.14762 type:complete len:247 (+) Transcript_9001:98-838(+)
MAKKPRRGNAGRPKGAASSETGTAVAAKSPSAEPGAGHQRRKASKAPAEAVATARSAGRGRQAQAATASPAAAAAAERKRKKRWRKRAAKSDDTAKPGGESSGAPEKVPKCLKHHAMIKRTTNPRGYSKKACCDVCGLENLPKKRPHFFHCSFCRFDLCPKCSVEFEPETRSATRKRKRGAEEAEKGPGTPAAASKKRPPQQLARSEEPGWNRARREIWLPTDSTAVNRAPLDAKVVSDWLEGVPL